MHFNFVSRKTRRNPKPETKSHGPLKPKARNSPEGQEEAVRDEAREAASLLAELRAEVPAALGVCCGERRVTGSCGLGVAITLWSWTKAF